MLVVLIDMRDIAYPNPVVLEEDYAVLQLPDAPGEPVAVAPQL